MKKKYIYKSLADTLIQLKKQAIESIPYCYDLTANIDNPEQLFEYLKTIITYKRDPPGIELLQTAKTLIENNWHGQSGYGDCDCFSILSLACLYCIGENNLFTIVAGQSDKSPSHIYTGFLKHGTFYDFDLTTDYFNVSRPYKYRKILKTVL
jgi:hypothetical protein